MVGERGDGLVGKSASHLVDKIDEGAGWATVKGVETAAFGALADVVVVIV